MWGEQKKGVENASEVIERMAVPSTIIGEFKKGESSGEKIKNSGLDVSRCLPNNQFKIFIRQLVIWTYTAQERDENQAYRFGN